MRISDWSSDVCSSDLGVVIVTDHDHRIRLQLLHPARDRLERVKHDLGLRRIGHVARHCQHRIVRHQEPADYFRHFPFLSNSNSRSHWKASRERRSEEHTSELQSLMRLSYAAFCLKKNK